MTNEMNSISVNELTKIFPHPSKENTNIPIFAGATFQIDSNSLNFLLGISGSGKTTLFRILASLEPIDAGEVFFNELAIHNLTYKQRLNYLKQIGFLDQFPSKQLLLNLSVKENLDNSLLKRTNLPKEERMKRIMEIVNNFGIDHLLKKMVIHLSGGELRRLMIACNLIFEPTLLLCDEPTAHLDEENKFLVIKNLQDSLEYSNALIFIATHDQTITSPKKTFEIKNRRIQKCQ